MVLQKLLDQLKRAQVKQVGVMSKPSQRLKTSRFPLLWTDQKGLCLYCKTAFTDTFRPEYDHLNNNTNDNRIENWALVCHACNNRKKGNIEMNVIASDKLKTNQKREYVCARMQEDLGMTKEPTTSQAINKTNMRITEQFLMEYTIHDEELLLLDAINAVVNLCYSNNETGSVTAVRRYIGILCNRINGKYSLSLNKKGETIIRRRTEN